MAETAIVAAIQPRWKRYESEDTLREECARYVRLAREKGADVALFPELMGLLLSGPLAMEKKDSFKKRGGLMGRLFGSFSIPDLADAMPVLITEYGDELTERYNHFFGALAREHEMVIVGGTLLAKTEEEIVQYRAGVFDRTGVLLGWQAKLHLTEEEGAQAHAGESLSVFETDFGRFGVLVGHDLLFPELARALAYRGCVGILHPTLARSTDSWQRQQIVARARAQENQMFVAQSFMVGKDDIFAGPQKELSGRSGVFAPVELSPRRDGILAMMGAEKVEGVVTGEWNGAALSNLWDTSDVPVRTMLRGKLFHELLALDYQSGSTMADHRNLRALMSPRPAEARDEARTEVDTPRPLAAPALPVVETEQPSPDAAAGSSRPC